MKNNHLKTVESPSLGELKNFSSFSKREDLIIECIEKIPHNSCESPCPRGAIPVGNSSSIDLKKCVGCGRCIGVCPGLSIYIKNYYYSEKEALISFPYEFLPLPKIGDQVILVGKEGEEICTGKVVKISDCEYNHQTSIISVAYSKDYFKEVVTMKRL